MKVFIDGKLYDSDVSPVVVCLEKEDKDFISAMDPNDNNYACFPGGTERADARLFMDKCLKAKASGIVQMPGSKKPKKPSKTETLTPEDQKLVATLMKGGKQHITLLKQCLAAMTAVDRKEGQSDYKPVISETFIAYMRSVLKPYLADSNF
jgi:hypothetical protein